MIPEEEPKFFEDGFLQKIAQSVYETEEEFIFTTINTYCQSVTEKRVSKALLKRALYCFKTEHQQEYEFLTSEEEE